MTDETTSGNYEYLFTTTDCIGKSVALKHGTFSGKILRKHSELTTDIIKESVESAHLVVVDHNDSKRRRYYRTRLNPIEGRNGLANIKVVVEETTTEYDEVVTAYIVGNLKNEISKGGIIYDAGSASKS